MISIGTATTGISSPSSRVLCGTSARAAVAHTSVNVATVSAARDGRNRGPFRIWSRLIDTATNSRPVSAAAAPTSAARQYSHPAVPQPRRSELSVSGVPELPG